MRTGLLVLVKSALVGVVRWVLDRLGVPPWAAAALPAAVALWYGGLSLVRWRASRG